MDADELLLYYRDLERLSGWTDDDGRRLAGLRKRIEPRLEELIDDHRKAIAPAPGAQPDRTAAAIAFEHLAGVLRTWLADLCSDRSDGDRAARCRNVGVQHAEIGLAPARAHLAFSRLRRAVRCAAAGSGRDSPPAAALESLDKRLDLDLAFVWEAHQRESARRLEEAERVESIRRLIGGMAHELRQPLNILRTSAYYLLHTGDLKSAKAAEHLQRIERQVALADRAIHTMSSYAKLAAPEVTPVSIPLSLGEALETNPMPPGIDVSIDCPEDLAPVPADFGQLQIVLGNLVRNARDAMPEGGRLSLAVRETRDGVEIAVADTGKGIAPAELGRITEPLYTTKERGMGLGLAITRVIIENHGGEFRVESEPGRGATFTVTLVRAAAPAEKAKSHA
jgi:signal transduction histidine kinase